MAHAADVGRPSRRQVFADLLARLTEAAHKVYGDRLVSLAVFGSVARDRPRPDSDINLFVVAEPLPAERTARAAEFARVEAELEPHLEQAGQRGVNTHLSPVIRTTGEMEASGPPFIDMVLESRVLYDRDGFFGRFAERFRAHLAATGARRVSDRGPAHWRASPFAGTLSQARMIRSYLFKARVRLEALDFYFSRGAYSDVVREAQEVVEISLKAILWSIGVEPPKVHNVGPVVVSYQSELPPEVAPLAPELARVSKWLGKEREFAFYGDADLVPTAEYTEDEARRAMEDARLVVKAAEAGAGFSGHSGSRGKPGRGIL